MKPAWHIRLLGGPHEGLTHLGISLAAPPPVILVGPCDRETCVQAHLHASPWFWLPEEETAPDGSVLYDLLEKVERPHAEARPYIGDVRYVFRGVAAVEAAETTRRKTAGS